MADSRNPPIIAITMWPAVRLAPNRRARIKGRTPTLTVSIKIKNGLRAAGAPEGSNDAITFWGLWKILEIISVTQKGRLKESVTAKCLVSPKTYEIRLHKFKNRIKINSLAILKEK